MGVIRERRGETAEAERSFQRSVDEEVGEVSSNFHLAAIHRARGDEEGADELLRTTREFARANGLGGAALTGSRR